MTASAAIRRKLEQLSDKQVNYDPEAVDLEHPSAAWQVDDRLQQLPPEQPGQPAPGGSWQTASRLIRGYEFADPSIVRAYYDGDAPLAGRNMLLELRALGLVSIHVGVRVNAVYDETRELGGRKVRVFGWSYRTLEGHVEMGQMDWEVYKRIDTGEVQFHVHAVSRLAPIQNPVIKCGFLLLRGHERRLFLDSTQRRMVTFTELGRTGDGERVRRVSSELTAHRLSSDDPVHGELGDRLSPRNG